MLLVAEKSHLLLFDPLLTYVLNLIDVKLTPVVELRQDVKKSAVLLVGLQLLEVTLAAQMLTDSVTWCVGRVISDLEKGQDVSQDRNHHHDLLVDEGVFYSVQSSVLVLGHHTDTFYRNPLLGHQLVPFPELEVGVHKGGNHAFADVTHWDDLLLLFE